MVQYLASEIDGRENSDAENEDLRPDRAAVCVLKFQTGHEADLTKRANECLSRWQEVVIENFTPPDDGYDFSSLPETLARLHGALTPKGFNLGGMTEWQCT